ncbi:unnamed protein product [Amoebophrya sp. A120]|nr:unnamed protein product [Amoebophrya sp. A120]|eukprot:GSA120T00007908001.1
MSPLPVSEPALTTFPSDDELFAADNSPLAPSFGTAAVRASAESQHIDTRPPDILQQNAVSDERYSRSLPEVPAVTASGAGQVLVDDQQSYPAPGVTQRQPQPHPSKNVQKLAEVLFQKLDRARRENASLALLLLTDRIRVCRERRLREGFGRILLYSRGSPALAAFTSSSTDSFCKEERRNLGKVVPGRAPDGGVQRLTDEADMNTDVEMQDGTETRSTTCDSLQLMDKLTKLVDGFSEELTEYRYLNKNTAGFGGRR